MEPKLDAVNFHSHRWRLENLYWIADKHAQHVLFKPNEAQVESLDTMGTRDIILKARQLGFTTLLCLISLDECLWNPNHNAAIIAHKLDDAKRIFQSKIKFPYENLPPQLREALPTVKDSADALHFSNGSSITVTTSARSGTLQRLHVSEFGKLCSTMPDRAREIVTGSFPATENGCITIESTAEGQEGRFYEMTEAARAGRTEWGFHFAPWWADAGNVYDPAIVTIDRVHLDYFAKLKHEDGIDLTPEQQAWWVRSEQTLGGDMKRENPATPDEAFAQAIEGSYFATQLAYADARGLIGRFPYDPKFPVNTFWDLGRNDQTTIWLHQRAGQRNRFVAYYENSGEHISHYIRWLREWGKSMNVEWGEHYWPHDGDRQDLFLENGRLAEAEKQGFRPNIVDRVVDKMQAIDAMRAVFPSCDFDEIECAQGIRHLRQYRKAWDENRQVFKSKPHHDAASDGADGILTFATGYKPTPISPPRDRYARRGSRPTSHMAA